MKERNLCKTLVRLFFKVGKVLEEKNISKTNQKSVKSFKQHNLINVYVINFYN